MRRIFKGFSKKGSLNLSINAIVVLILAITMLGLGLGFMKNMFGGVTDQFGTVTEEMQKDMVERLKDGTKKIALNVYQIEMNPSEKRNIYLGISNELGALSNDQPHKFQIVANNAAAALNGDSGKCPEPKTYEYIELESGAQTVLPVLITSRSDTIEGCKYKIVLKYCGNNIDIETDDKCDNDPDQILVYGSEDYYITVK